jgi:nicotinamide-nucleotide adenylyltransferase
MKIPVFLGRFQPFHSGHRSIVENILAEYPSMTLIIGSSNISGTEENPWSYIERLSIISENIPEALLDRVTIYPLPDVPDDTVWCENLKQIIPHNSILFTGNEWVRDLCTVHDVQTDWIVPTIDISATKIREMIRNGEEVSQWTNIV